MSGITGIIGDRGAGKTCFMTYQLFKDYQRGRPIISNYHLEFGHNKLSFSEIAELPESLNNSTIGLDEIHIGVDSRASMSSINRQITKLATQLRKRNIILYYTTQRFNLIDKRLRQQTDLLATCCRVKDGIFRIETINNYTGDSEGVKIFKGFKYFSLYNTNEVIDFD